MYNRDYWKDHAMTPEHTYKVTANSDGTYTAEKAGKVIQQGTSMNAAHFNNMETGISNAQIALDLAMFELMQDEYNNKNELHVLDLAMDKSADWPFNNKETTVALTNTRESINYSVEVDVLQYSGGRLGDIRVLDRACNGFKLRHEGSAKQVQVAVRVSGGMEDPLLDEDEIEEPEYTSLEG